MNKTSVQRRIATSDPTTVLNYRYEHGRFLIPMSIGTVRMVIDRDVGAIRNEVERRGRSGIRGNRSCL